MDNATYPTEDGNFVRFEWSTDKNNAASEREGRPVYDKVLRAAIFAPGQAKSEAVYIIERYADGGEAPTKRRDDVIARIRKPHDAFKRDGDGGERTGTPLDAWPALDIRQVAELKALNVFTVEALADLSDTALQQMGMGARDLKTRARAFLDAAAGNADTERLAAENERLKDEIDRLRKQVEAIGTKRGPGRPRKTDEEAT